MTEKLQHSDAVLSWGEFNPEVCQRYGVKVWGWGPYYDSKKVAEAYALGFRMVASLVNLNIREPHDTEVGRDLFYNPKLSQTTCRDIAGEPIIVPWWPREYGDNNRAYWHCTKQPLYREHLKRVARSGVLAGGNALHVDDSLSNALVVRLPKTGGCFCDVCVEGFRKYLCERYTAPERATRGIGADFDYRKLVRTVATTRAAYAEAYAEHRIPLQEEFRLYQTEGASDFLGELIRCAKDVVGGDLPVSANLGTMRPEALLAAIHPDFFVIELHFWRPTGDFPLQPLQLAQAFGKKCATWPIGADVDRIRREKATGMLKLWVATTYALGHNFMMPNHMWCSTDATGMVFYDAPEAEFLPLYRFIRENAALFDDFEAVPQFGLIYCNRDARTERPVGERTGWEMFDRNLSYQLLLAGDEYCSDQLDRSVAEPYEKIIVPDAATLECLDAEQRRLVEGWLATGKAVYWTDIREQDLKASVRTANQSKVWALPRRRDAAGKQAMVVHLIDHEYDLASNTFGALKPVSLEIDRRLFGSTIPEKAFLRSPTAPTVELPVTVDGACLRVEAKMTDYWNLLTF